MSLNGPIVLVGAGNMGGAILKGWLDSGIEANRIVVVDPSLSAQMAQLLDSKQVSHYASMPLGVVAGVLMLAIKPQLMDAVLPNLVDAVDDQSLIVSVAAGTTISNIKDHLSAGIVVRTMPNTPAMIGRGVTGVYPERALAADEKALIDQLLSVCGSVEWVESERDMDAVTAVSGSGPAYVFLLAEVMAAAGVREGLAPELALRLAKDTISGAGELMRQSDDAPDILRQNVTSPGGTTAAALNEFMKDDALLELVATAIGAAKLRSEELSK